MSIVGEKWLCDNSDCGREYAATSARITVEMWGRAWVFCSGECLALWADFYAQELWSNNGEEV